MWSLIRTLFSRELIRLGISDLKAHKLRSFLTALGVIFGVGAVICMLSIGEGASAEQLNAIRLLGSRNIILRSVEPPARQDAGEANTTVQQFGLVADDIARLRKLPHIDDVVLMRDVADTFVYRAKKYEGRLLGTTPNFFNVVRVQVSRGRALTEADSQLGQKVCVVGSEVARVLFGHEDPLGKHVSVISPSTGVVPYRVVGLLEDVQAAGTPQKGKADRNMNGEVYVPLGTADHRYGDLKVRWSRGRRDIKRVQYSDVYVSVDDEVNVLETSELVNRVLEHGHKEPDYQVIVPLAQLRLAEQTKRNRQIVLGSIAGISLLVGGIGIMNIMLASVTERTREIGIRRALGAKRVHITAQFLIETLILSVGGGLIGIAVGIGFAFIAAWQLQWQTIIPWWGVILSFVVSALVGVGFGLYPARRAAALDPIEALRYQ